MTHQETDRIVRTAEAARLTGYTNTHLIRLEQAGLFPPRFKLNPACGKYGAVGWKLSSIQSWIDQRASVAGSD